MESALNDIKHEYRKIVPERIYQNVRKIPVGLLFFSMKLIYSMKY